MYNIAFAVAIINLEELQYNYCYFRGWTNRINNWNWYRVRYNSGCAEWNRVSCHLPHIVDTMNLCESILIVMYTHIHCVSNEPKKAFAGNEFAIQINALQRTRSILQNSALRRKTYNTYPYLASHLLSCQWISPSYVFKSEKTGTVLSWSIRDTVQWDRFPSIVKRKIFYLARELSRRLPSIMRPK